MASGSGDMHINSSNPTDVGYYLEQDARRKAAAAARAEAARTGSDNLEQVGQRNPAPVESSAVATTVVAAAARVGVPSNEAPIVSGALRSFFGREDTGGGEVRAGNTSNGDGLGSIVCVTMTTAWTVILAVVCNSVCNV